MQGVRVADGVHCRTSVLVAPGSDPAQAWARYHTLPIFSSSAGKHIPAQLHAGMSGWTGGLGMRGGMERPSAARGASATSTVQVGPCNCGCGWAPSRQVLNSCRPIAALAAYHQCFVAEVWEGGVLQVHTDVFGLPG